MRGNGSVRRVLLAWLLTSAAVWGAALVLAVHAYRTGGAGAVGLMALMRTLPGAPAGLFLAREGDRRSRPSVLITVNVVRGGALAGAAAAVVAGAPLAVLYVLAVALAVAGPAYKPAQAALLPLLARTPAELTRANAGAAMCVNLGFLAGTLGGGVVLARTSAGAALAVFACMLGASIAVLVGLPRDDHGAGAQDARPLFEGLRMVGGDRRLRALVGVLGALALVEGAVDVLVVATALGPLGLGEAGAGAIWAAWGIGAVAGGAGVLRLLDRRRLVLSLTAGALLLGAALAPVALVPAVGAVAVLLAMAGAGYTLAEVAAHTLLQRLAADPVLARVFGVVEIAVVLAGAAGGAAAGSLLAAFGPGLAWPALGLVLPAAALACRRQVAGAELGAPAPEREYRLLQGHPVFAPLPVATKERLAASLVEVRAGAGAAVIAEGDLGDRFYLVAAGCLEVTEGGSYRRTMGPGDGFGEIALLRDVPRTATVRARGPVVLLALDRETFLNAVTGQPHSARAADRLVQERIGPSAGQTSMVNPSAAATTSTLPPA